VDKCEIETLKAIIAGLQQQLLRIGNQQDVLKAAYLAGQMAKPVKTFSGNKPNYTLPTEGYLTEWDINKLITEYGLTVVDGDIYGFAWAVQQASRPKQT
jgi:hypothetical protein